MTFLFGYQGLVPHGSCLLWLSELFWTHAAADALIAAAYYSISVTLVVLVRRRPDRLLRRSGLLFAAFIVACATSHVMDIWTLWYPDYDVQALIKVATAAISVVTAVYLWPLLPRILALPSISQLEQANAALADYTHQLESTLEHLDLTRGQLLQAEKMASLGGLVAGIAHEINTPVGNGVTVATSLAERVRRFRARLEGPSLKRSLLEGFADEVAEAAQLLTANLDTAAALIRSFKQVAADQTSSHRRGFDLRETVEEVVATLRPSFRRSGHSVDVDIEAGLTLDSYPGPFGQVVVNLVTNSLQHGFADDTPGHIHLSARPAGPGRVRLLYRDDGVGIPPELQGRVFEPFFTTRQGRGGTGLGLHVIYNIVTNVLGGTLSLTSAPGAGVEFAIDLPVNAPRLGTAAASAMPA